MSNTEISEQVLADSDVIDFKVVSTELLSQEFLVTFEVSLTASEDVVEKLSEIFSKIEFYKLDSVVVTEQYTDSEDGKFCKQFSKIIIKIQAYGSMPLIQKLMR